MDPFFFKLTLAAGFGALVARILPLGLLEIVLAIGLANLGFYFYRRRKS